MTAGQIRIFKGRVETLNLLFPALLVAPFLYFVFAGTSFDGPHDREWLKFVESVLFLSVLHNAFTFHMLLSLPEMRAFEREERRSVPWLGVWTEFALIFAVMFCFFRWLVDGVIQSQYVYLLPLAVAVIELHHGLKQKWGLSVLYNQNLRRAQERSPEQLRALERRERHERLAFDVMLYVTTVFLVLTITPLRTFTRGLQIALFVACMAAVLFVLFNSWRHEGPKVSNKFWFQLRLLFLPWTPVFPFGSFFMSSTHGVEYAGVYHQMMTNSKTRHGTRTLIVSLLGVIFLLILYSSGELGDRGLAWLIRPWIGEAGVLLPWLAALGSAITFTHFYADRRLFSMKNPRVRRHVGPLLTGRGSGEGAA